MLAPKPDEPATVRCRSLCRHEVSEHTVRGVDKRQPSVSLMHERFVRCADRERFPAPPLSLLPSSPGLTTFLLCVGKVLRNFSRLSTLGRGTRSEAQRADTDHLARLASPIERSRQRTTTMVSGLEGRRGGQSLDEKLV